MTILLPTGILVGYAVGALWFARHVLPVTALAPHRGRPPLADGVVFGLDCVLAGVWPLAWAAIAIVERARNERS